jgi:hypothetical protein
VKLMPGKIIFVLFLTPLIALAVTHPGEQLPQRVGDIPVSGFVYDEAGEPIANIDILVHFIDEDGEQHSWVVARTPADGHYFFTVPEGKGYLTCEYRQKTIQRIGYPSVVTFSTAYPVIYHWYLLGSAADYRNPLAPYPQPDGRTVVVEPTDPDIVEEIKLAAPRLLEPEKNAKDVNERADFLWAAVSGADRYAIQIGEDEAMRERWVDAINLPDTSFKPNEGEELPTGDYFWRVRAGDGRRWSLWSESSPFSVLSAADQAMQTITETEDEDTGWIWWAAGGVVAAGIITALILIPPPELDDLPGFPDNP